MTARNVYATLAEYKAFAVPRSQTAAISSDSADDIVIDGLLEAASRYMDEKTARWFYPRIETRSYNLPADDELLFDADLLAILSFSNGDDTSISSTAYNLLPKNDYPKYGLKLKGSSSVEWESDSNGDSDYVMDLTAIFGFHDQYADAWSVGSTLAEALDTSELGWDVTSGTLFSAGQILRVDNEISIVSAVVSNALTMIARGANGSTAVAHDSGATVYIWEPMEALRNAVLEIALRAYKRRSGQSQGNDSIVTAAGMVLPPKDVPMSAIDFIKAYGKLV
jgi:hypothetical protein